MRNVGALDKFDRTKDRSDYQSADESLMGKGVKENLNFSEFVLSVYAKLTRIIPPICRGDCSTRASFYVVECYTR